MSRSTPKGALFDRKVKEDHHHPTARCSSLPLPSSPTNSSGENHQHLTPRSTSTPTSSSQALNIDVEFGEALHSESYKEIWSKIHVDFCRHEPMSPDAGVGDHRRTPPPSPFSTRISVTQILKPDQETVNHALYSNQDTETMLELISSYFRNSEQVSELSILLINGVNNARTIYGALYRVLDLFPGDHHGELTALQRDYVDGVLSAFVGSQNPFQSPPETHGLEEMRCRFSDLSSNLDRYLVRSRKRRRLLRRIKKGSALCLIGTTVTVAGVAIVVATHALIAMFAVAMFCPPWTFVKRKAGSVRLLSRRISQLQVAAMGVFVLNHHLTTVYLLVIRLSAMFESDRELVRVALGRAGGDDVKYYPMLVQEVVRLMSKNHSSLQESLDDLEKHVCFFLTSLNRTRTNLLAEICNNS